MTEQEIHDKAKAFMDNANDTIIINAEEIWKTIEATIPATILTESLKPLLKTLFIKGYTMGAIEMMVAKLSLDEDAKKEILKG